jgi:signal peptidase I
MPSSSPAVEGRPREGVRDTLESITIALILAFVFRAFVVEAFVIPTGSMAPTLYGAHGTIVCEDCGTEFAYGLQDLKDQRKTVPIRASDKAYCPNCGHPNTNLKIHDERRNPESGDRILVLKWPFHLSGDLHGPARWDVVVFKDPADGVTNFIKRLVGLPNEVLMIVDGDVYTVPTSEISEAALGELDRLRREKYELRVGRTYGTLRKVPRFVLEELNTKMRIVRKTAVAQKALWIPVYDHDHPPRTTEKPRPHWVPKRHDLSGWDASNRRIRFEDRGVEEDCIELGGLPIRANCSYNIRRTSPHHQFTPRAEPPIVSDQRVRFVLTPLGTTGSVGVSLTKLARVFRATIHVDGTLHIEEVDDASGAAKPVMLSTRRPPFVPGESVEISFENVDYRLVLRVDGEELLATTDDPESEGYYGPNLKSLRRLPQAQYISRPRIYAEGGRFDLTHLVVARDVYHYQDPRSTLPPPWRAHAPSWGSPDSPILLRGHEYFMLGDNPAASKDSRLWDTIGPHLLERGEACQLGTVSADQLVGKAFFVYWPSMQRIKWLEWLPLFRRWGVVPDVGRMRWIR